MKRGQTTDQRTRTFTWHDPLIGAEAATRMAGLEFLEAVRRGALPPPPVMTALGIGTTDKM